MSIILALMLAAGQPAAYSPNCNDPQTQTDLNICSQRDAAAADADLNAIWPTVRAKMQADDREWAALQSADKRPGYWPTALAAQRAWLTLRDKQCQLEGYAARGGTMESMLVSGCRERMTRARIAELGELIKADE